MSELGVAAIARARVYNQQDMETDGPNRGPLIDRWVAARGAPLGSSWCAAFVCDVVLGSAADLGLTLKFRPSASAMHLISLNPDLVVADPEPGDVVVWNHGHGLGHTGIVTGATRVEQVLADIIVISGNTNASGAREGTGVKYVWERAFALPGPHPIAGYLRLA